VRKDVAEDIIPLEGEHCFSLHRYSPLRSSTHITVARLWSSHLPYLRRLRLPTQLFICLVHASKSEGAQTIPDYKGCVARLMTSDMGIIPYFYKFRILGTKIKTNLVSIWFAQRLLWQNNNSAISFSSHLRMRMVTSHWLPRKKPATRLVDLETHCSRP
jgi:hypothetical protein